MIEQIATPNGRMYKTPEGNLYPSVSTVLSKTGDDTWLKEWRKAVGEKEANFQSRMASTRGTKIHELCENHLNGIQNTFEVFDVNRLAYESLVPHLNKIDDVRCIEERLYSDKIKTAGTVDCIAAYDGKLAVLDWKTSRKEKYSYEIEGYYLQAAAYAYMYYERTGIAVENIVIVMAVDFSEAKVFIENPAKWFPKFVDLRKKYAEIIK